jgi:hypothetical protein
MKLSQILRRAQVGTVNGQIQFLGDYVTGEISKLFQKLGQEAGDQKLYITHADFRAWKSATDRVFKDLTDFADTQEIGENPLPADYQAGEPPH